MGGRQSHRSNCFKGKRRILPISRGGGGGRVAFGCLKEDGHIIFLVSKGGERRKRGYLASPTRRGEKGEGLCTQSRRGEGVDGSKRANRSFSTEGEGHDYLIHRTEYWVSEGKGGPWHSSWKKMGFSGEGKKSLETREGGDYSIAGGRKKERKGGVRVCHLSLGKTL